MNSDMQKNVSRDRARARRKIAVREAGPGTGDRIAAFGMEVLGQSALPSRPVVAGYWPLGSEADVRPLLARVHGAGMRCVLPVVRARTSPLFFRAWSPGDTLVDGLLGTPQPDGEHETLRPDVILTPLLAFDGVGYRLGQGGGYYDRTLDALRAEGRVVAVGIALEAQRQDAVPRGPHDQRLDWVVTEAGAYRFG